MSANAPFLWASEQRPEQHVAGETTSHFALGAAKRSAEDHAVADAMAFRRQYEREVQRVFSRVQHHWHQEDKDGQNLPMKYCRIRAKLKGGCNCKMGFPRHVPIVNGVLQ